MNLRPQRLLLLLYDPTKYRRYLRQFPKSKRVVQGRERGKERVYIIYPPCYVLFTGSSCVSRAVALASVDLILGVRWRGAGSVVMGVRER